MAKGRTTDTLRSVIHISAPRQKSDEQNRVCLRLKSYAREGLAIRALEESFGNKQRASEGSEVRQARIACSPQSPKKSAHRLLRTGSR